MAGLLRPAGITTQRFGPSEVVQEPPALGFGPMPARGRGRAAAATALRQGFDDAKAKAVTELELASEKVRALGAR